MTRTRAATRTIEVFADILCPLTHVGLRTFVDRRDQHGLAEPRLRIRAWPLELINGKPLDPHHIDAEFVALRRSVRPDLFSGFSVDTFPSTSMAAFALTVAADRTGDPTLVEEVGMALRPSAATTSATSSSPGNRARRRSSTASSAEPGRLAVRAAVGQMTVPAAPSLRITGRPACSHAFMPPTRL